MDHTLMRKKSDSTLVEDTQVRALLSQIVAGFTQDPQLQQDLVQECLVHLWKLEVNKPGHKRSWYLQGCRFHLQHYLSSGRSVDSLKRAGGGNRITIDGDDEEPALHDHHTNGEVLDAVCFQDVVSTLKGKIRPREWQVLKGLANGMVAKEIASEFGISRPTVLKYRRRLAALIAQLRISEPRSVLKCQGDRD
jgi:DNA-directed RNA polymerase specialized sigma24 family protein